MRRKWFTCGLALLFVAGVADAGIDVKLDMTAGDAGKIYFTSAARETTFTALLMSKISFTDTITGDLVIPATASAGKIPAMVIMHGSSGVDAGSSHDWAEFLNHMGIATFIVDSFEARGIENTVKDQSLLSFNATAIDGFRALQMLATHPKIDPDRIGIMGFSRGGVGAQMTGLERLRAAVIPGNLKYALHIPVYGGCSLYGRTDGSPILHLIGDKDDYSGIDNCRRNTELMKKKGADILMIEYPGALHGFDVDRPARYLPQNQTWRNCTAQTDIDTLNSQLPGDERPLSLWELVEYKKSCLTYGVRYGGDPQAREDARRQVKIFLFKHFNLTNTDAAQNRKERQPEINQLTQSKESKDETEQHKD